MLAGFDLTARELDVVNELDMAAVQRYADGLIRKRLRIVEKWLPLTMSVLDRGVRERSMPDVLVQYAVENIRDDEEIGGGWVRNESARVFERLKGLVAEGVIRVSYFLDVLEFEATELSMITDPEVETAASKSAERSGNARIVWDVAELASSRPLAGKHVRVKCFDYDMPRLVAALAQGQTDLNLGREACWILFLKKAGTPRPQASTLNPPSRDLLLLSCGDATLAEISDVLFASYGDLYGVTPKQVAKECVALTQQLYEYGAITFA